MAELKFPTLEELGRQGGEWALNVFEYKGYTIREWADKITTGEYQHVKHGHWIKKGNWIICSNCNHKINDKHYNKRHSYIACPYCCAKMDEEKRFETQESTKEAETKTED